MSEREEQDFLFPLMRPGYEWYYLSFASPTEFLGGCYVKGENPQGAYMAACVLHLNPGGEVQIYGPIPRNLIENVPKSDRYRLLSREEIQK